jgi:hypothetical protein
MAPSNELASVDLVSHGTDQESNSSDPPDGGYGWVVCGACFIINCFTWGLASVTMPRFPSPPFSTSMLCFQILIDITSLAIIRRLPGLLPLS